jgi:hypothetical protein
MEGIQMIRKIFSILSLLTIPILVLMNPWLAYSESADSEAVAHMKAGHQKIEGVVSQVKSGLYTVKTSTGATLTLTESTAFRQGQNIPKVGDELTLWVKRETRQGSSLHLWYARID